MTISEFLLARITEDEAVASAAMSGPWASSIEGRDHLGGDDVILGGGGDLYLTAVGVTTAVWTGTQDHIARHDPARVLAECEAKRRIVDNYLTTATTPFAVMALAAVYASHPDYQQEWTL